MYPFKNDDQSEYLIHLVGKENSYNSFMSILSSQRILAKTAFGYNRSTHKKKSVCFSEIPPVFLQKLVNRRYNHGIAFKKNWLRNNGAQRVWYIEKDSELHSTLNAISATLTAQTEKLFHNLAPYIDISGEHGYSTYRFEWEREWRMLSNLDFTPDDVEFLILPGELHDAARNFFASAEEEQTGPNYRCEYYDPIRDIYSEPT